MSTENKFRSGFANIIGHPNVGKSTLLNGLLGEKLSIVTQKKQTTRHRIQGILTGRNHQIVFSDTPGILDPKYLLQKRMMQFVNQAMEDADVFLYLLASGESAEYHQQYIEKLTEKSIPVLLVINKIDLSDQETLEAEIDTFKKWVPEEQIIPVSAKEGFNLEKLVSRVVEHLPENHPFFPDDQLTDKSERFIVSETIREKILNRFKQEVPYSIEVNIEEFEENPDIINIRGEIVVNKDSQKPIIIGKNGQALKKIGTEAREDIEPFLKKQVYLELFVKVRENWRDKEMFLNQFGYRS